MLAVLKAGGTFVPLDPSHPMARLESLIKEVEANIIICSAGHEFRLSSAAEYVLDLDDARFEALAAENTDGNEDLTNTCQSSNAAYILFTSGSTGRPKVR